MGVKLFGKSKKKKENKFQLNHRPEILKITNKLGSIKNRRI